MKRPTKNTKKPNAIPKFQHTPTMSNIPQAREASGYHLMTLTHHPNREHVDVRHELAENLKKEKKTAPKRIGNKAQKTQTPRLSKNLASAGPHRSPQSHNNNKATETQHTSSITLHLANPAHHTLAGSPGHARPLNWAFADLFSATPPARPIFRFQKPPSSSSSSLSQSAFDGATKLVFTRRC